MLLLKNEPGLESKEEVENLLKSFKTSKNPFVLEKLVKQYEGMVYYLSQRFRVPPSSKEDLVQVGFLGLIQAIKRFNPEFKKDFLSFAIPSILGEMKRYLRDKTWDVKVPRRLQELGLRIQKTVDVLSQELGRTPNLYEISSNLGVSEEEVAEGIAAGASYDALSLDSSSNEEEDGVRSIDDLASHQAYDKGETEERRFLEQALEKLATDERKVIEWRFYDHFPQAEIAKRLGISQVQVSRIQRRALSKLKKELLNV